MVNLKCRKLFMRDKEFHCLVKRKIITDCDKDCKDMDVMDGKMWKEIIGFDINEYKKVKIL